MKIFRTTFQVSLNHGLSWHYCNCGDNVYLRAPGKIVEMRNNGVYKIFTDVKHELLEGYKEKITFKTAPLSLEEVFNLCEKDFVPWISQKYSFFKKKKIVVFNCDAFSPIEMKETKCSSNSIIFREVWTEQKDCSIDELSRKLSAEDFCKYLKTKGITNLK